METLEQYGIKDVTPGRSEGSSERLRGEFERGRHQLKLYIEDEYLGVMWNAKYLGKVIGGKSMYGNEDGVMWLDEVKYN